MSNSLPRTLGLWNALPSAVFPMNFFKKKKCTYPFGKTDNALVTPLELRAFMGGRDHVLFDAPYDCLPLAVNLYITALVMASVSWNTKCHDHRHQNDTGSIDTTTNDSRASDFDVNVNHKPLYWMLFLSSGIFLNLAWVYYNYIIFLDFYESKLSKPRVLVTMAFIHLFVMITIFVISAARHQGSPSFTLAVICQIAIIIFIIAIYVFHIVYLYEMALRRQKKVNHVHLKHFLLMLKCKQVHVQDVVTISYSYPRVRKTLITPLGLGVSMDGDDQLLSGGSEAHLPLESAVKKYVLG
ncbi:hypothetical protein EVAR_45750_1 [Eumeta japonica]|uniref:Uncharacterized protein n=1 Tax=Eumeta variegata TaxID=151549 RepID=A0A4C1YTH8_EUMVA|nr:hypothetical protein EVAR_45750_1 [Eumeta japonica]